MKIGSLFSGIGGLELGLERATGGRVVWQAESDPHARRVLERHWPGVKIYEDVRDIDGGAERVDLICGGFPCTDISTAGKQEGIDGEQSGLWSEFARIVGVLRPRIVFVENVAALASNGLDRVLGDLAEIGFDAEWDIVGACCVGAPHRRERMFILAWCAQGGSADTIRNELRFKRIRGGQQRGEQGAAKSGDDGEHWDVADATRIRRTDDDVPSGSQSQHMAAAVDSVVAHADRGQRTQGREPLARPQPHAGWETEPSMGRLADGISDRVDQIRCFGNAVVPQQAELAWHILHRRMTDSTTPTTDARIAR